MFILNGLIDLAADYHINYRDRMKKTSSNKFNSLQMLLVFFLGILTSLLLLEGCLYIIGYVYWRPEGRKDFDIKEIASDALEKCKGCKVILCLGDSYTYGMGVPANSSYPAHLERMLNSGSAKKKYLVLNGGRGGSNTSMALDVLSSYMEVVSLNHVVVMVGGANFWDYSGYVANRLRPTRNRSTWRFLHKIRIVRFTSQLYHHLNGATQPKEKQSPENTGRVTSSDLYLKWHKDKIREGKLSALSSHFKKGKEALLYQDYAAAISHFTKGVASNPLDGSHYWGLGYTYRTKRQYGRAREWYQKGIKVDPSNPNVYYGMGQICIDQMVFGEERHKWFRRGIQADPGFSSNYCQFGESLMATDEMNDAHERQDNPEVSRLLKKGIELDPDNLNCYLPAWHYYRQKKNPDGMVALLEKHKNTSAVAKSYIAMIKSKDRRRDSVTWLEDDLNQIADRLQKNGVGVVFMGYPMKNEGEPHLEKVAKERKIPFVINRDTFRKHAHTPEIWGKYFLQDNHCTNEGNRLVAKNLYDVLFDIVK